MRKALLAIAVLCSVTAAAADLSKRIKEGNDHLRRGDASTALGIFNELKAEAPDSPEVLFGLGCALYQEAMREGTPRTPEETQQLLDEARAAFERTETLTQGRLHVDSGYNHGNAMAQTAKKTAEDPQKAQVAYEQSIRAYEDFLKRNPGHERAQHNLDHMRYMLKRMKEEQPPPQQSGDDQNEDGDPQNQQQPQDGEQGEQEGDEQNPEQGEQDQKPGEQDSKEGQEQPDSQDTQQKQGQQKADMRQKASDKQSVQALLDSLEDVDKEEQRRMREAPHDRRIPEAWW